MALHDPANLIAMLGGLAYVALGLAVLAAAPRNAANRGFALFACASGSESFVFRMAEILGAPTGAAWDFMVWVILQVAIVAGLLIFARSFPRPVPRLDRPFIVAAVGPGIILLASWALLLPSWLERIAADASLRDQVVLFAVSSGLATSVKGVMWGALALLALRAERERESAASLAVVSLAIAAPAALAMSTTTLSPLPSMSLLDAVGRVVAACATVGLIVVLWLRNLERGIPPRWTLPMIWGIPLVILIGMIGYSVRVQTDSSIVWDGSAGAVRLFAGAILAYAIARGQVPGLASRVRWTVSRGTIAAAFVAAFFVASEGAQILFGQGNEWVGLFAAGMLVFAIAPLQRAAERLAEKAVPLVPASGASSTRVDESHDLYRYALRLALADRALSHEEEMKLARLAERLGLGPTDVARLRQEVEATRSVAGEGGGA